MPGVTEEQLRTSGSASHTEEFDISKDTCPERNKPALCSHTVDPEFLLKQIDDFACKSQQVPDLQLVLHRSTLTPAEVDSVLEASPAHRVGVVRT